MQNTHGQSASETEYRLTTEPIGLLSHASLIQLERHITAMLYSIWGITGQDKRIVKGAKHGR